MDVVMWQIRALSRGLFPELQYNGAPWAKAGQAGMDVGCRAVLTYIKGDWAEFQKTFGLSPWNNVYAP
eukprot:3856203-Pyramimonas_sp.AAC.1